MILGIGTDLVSIKRITATLSKFPEIFPRKLLSGPELEIYHQIPLAEQKCSYLAKRFAAKEAFAKATKLGIGAIGFRNISVLNYNSGQPYIQLAEEVGDKIWGSAKRAVVIHISISDEKKYALATVLLELAS